MSEIFVPPGVAITPKFKDGIVNTITRAPGLTSNAAAFTDIASVILQPNIFDDDRNDTLLHLEFLGRQIGNAGTRQYRFAIDGIAALTLQTLAAGSATPNPFLELRMIFRNNQVLLHGRLESSPSGTGSITTPAGNQSLFINFDPTIQHSLSLQVAVANPADTVICDWFGGIMR